MKRANAFCLFPFLTATLLLSQPNSEIHRSPAAKSQSGPNAQAAMLATYGKLPLSFEENHGQAAVQVKFLSRTSSYTLFLTSDEAVLALSRKKLNESPETRPAASPAGTTTALRLKLRNANPTAKVTGADELAGKSNYFIGNAPERWQTNVPTYAKVKYEKVYPGIDLVYYGNQRQLEYDFIVAPGADPSRIAFDISGANQIAKDAHGDLVFKTKTDNEIRWHKPVVYQQKDGSRQEIAARYAITAANRITFELAPYDATRPLYIDPLIYSTYLGGSSTDSGTAIAVDSEGSAYVTGGTISTNFPVTPGAFQADCNGCSSGSNNVFITKINPTGTALVYSTYLGGGGGQGESASSIAIDSAGNAYLTGVTYSPSFPVTPGAFQATCVGCPSSYRAFVTKLNSTGSALVYSTYLGGSGPGDGTRSVAVDSTGNAYVTGETSSADFPVTPGAFQTACNGGANCVLGSGFVTKLNPTGTTLTYSTFLGGSLGASAVAIAVDTSGNAYVTGETISTDFPVTPGAFQTICNDGNDCNLDGDAFVTKLNPAGSALLYSTYLGGNDADSGSGIAVDSSGNAYITGYTDSPNFPVTAGAFQTACSKCALFVPTAFVTKLNPKGSALIYSTYFGGSSVEIGVSIAVDSSGRANIVGDTSSFDLPVTSGAFQSTFGGTEFGGGQNAFVTRFNATGTALVYSSFLGGNPSADYGSSIALDSAGNAYVTGSTDNLNFPTINPLQPNYASGDAFVAKISEQASDVTLFPLHLDFGSQPMGVTTSPQSSTFTNVGTDALNIDSITIGGANPADFAETDNCGTQVAAGSSCALNFTFTASATGNRSATVTIADSATVRTSYPSPALACSTV